MTVAKMVTLQTMNVPHRIVKYGDSCFVIQQFIRDAWLTAERFNLAQPFSDVQQARDAMRAAFGEWEVVETYLPTTWPLPFEDGV